MEFLPIFFIIELALVLIIGRRLGYKNAYFWGTLIFFIYSQACYMDYVLFNKEIIEIPMVAVMSVYDDTFIYTSIAYFAFFVCFCIPALTNTKYFKAIENLDGIKRDLNTSWIFVLMFSLLLIYYNYSTFGLTRELKTEWLQQHKFMGILITCAFCYWVLYYLKANNSRLIKFLFTAVVVTSSILIAEREYPVIIGMTLIFSSRKTYSLWSIYFVIFAGLFLLGIWKAIFAFVVLRADVTGLGDWFQRYGASIADIDPKASFLIISDYFDYNHYSDYFMSYITNFINQVIRVFDKTTGYYSLGEYTREIVYNAKHGLAFSVILESFLNFWYLGPVVIGGVLGMLVVHTRKMAIRYGYFVEVFMVIFILKLVRTELMVVLKIYVLPMFVAYFLASLSIKKYLNVILQNNKAETSSAS